MQLARSRIWTRVAVSISYEDNHYTTGTSLLIYMDNQHVGHCWYDEEPMLKIPQIKQLIHKVHIKDSFKIHLKSNWRRKNVIY